MTRVPRRLIALSFWTFWSTLAAQSQAPKRVVRISVGDVQIKGGDVSLRGALIERLGKEKALRLVEAAAAELVLSGFGETYVKGYVGRNHRVRYKNSDSKAIHGGYLSVELKERNEETLWSDLVTPSRINAGDIGQDLAGQIATRLVKFLSSWQGGATP